MDRRRRRWVPIDVDLLSGDGRAVYERFGWAGVGVWVAFLTACSKASTPGRLAWRSENEALILMGLEGYELVDSLGETFTIAEFFAWTGRQHWTATTRRRHGGDTATTRARRWADWQPPAHRPAIRATEPQVKPRRRGRKGGKIGEEKGEKGGEVGGTHDLTQPSPTYEVEVGEERSPARATAGPSASRPADPHAAEPTAESEPGQPPPAARADPPGNGVPAESTATIDALLGRDRDTGPDSRSDDPEAERARQLDALKASGLLEPGRGPVDLPSVPFGEAAETGTPTALPPVVPASFHDELQRVKAAGHDEPGQVAEGGGP